MNDVVRIFINNFFGFDCIIFLMAAVNVYVYYLVRKETDKVYEHFNVQDQIINLSNEVKQTFRENTARQKKKLTAEELLRFRANTNRYYALYTNLTSIFPLMGMLGTVCSLIPMVNMMGTETANAFFAALTSTFWGIVFALIFKLTDASVSYKIEDNEKHVEYYLNPNKDKTSGDKG